ncbi:MAG TPA: thrombospondin type 3 repeat-containing protein [Polyangiaceae bacterium]|jgi:hypothetical protein|nr:thrombospondin type 3 repeat-containing protein [Polyangiaceae bacterium]
MRRLRSRAPRFGCAFAAGAFAVLAAATASAHSDFPGIIQETFGSSCAPQCTLCHVNAVGGQPLKGADFYVDGMNPSHRGYGVFVSNLKDRGVPSVPTSINLRDKLKLLQNEPCQKDAAKGSTADMKPCDTDGDGMSDWEELAADPARDPDVSGVGNGAICPSYGCGARIAALPRDAGANGRAAAVMAALGVALVLARRARR